MVFDKLLGESGLGGLSQSGPPPLTALLYQDVTDGLDDSCNLGFKWVPIVLHVLCRLALWQSLSLLSKTFLGLYRVRS